MIPALAHAGEGQFVHNGITLKYTDTGNAQGEPVILVHGFAVNRGLQWTMPGITRFISSQYRVILFDNRGHGTSTRPKAPDQYGMEMVHDIKRLMDHLHIQKAHMVGYSMGAFLTHKFAATYPDRVKSIVLGGAGWLREGPATEAMDQISESLRTKKSLEPLFRALHPPDAKPFTKEAAETASKMALLINDADALAGVAAGMKQFTLTEDEVKNLKVPTLCIVGQRDPLIESVKLMEGQRAQLRTMYIPRADHMNCFELPVFREAVLSFLKEQP
ncbi:MAG: alpha/beta hydrolase [Gemmatales bacterium]